jgi:hypothetical protein
MTIRCVFLASALMISAILPAAAAGDNVVLIAVNKVRLPPSLPGLCRLNASVTQVWEGKAFRAGQALVISVPCSAGNSFRTPANLVRGQSAHLIAVDVLLKSRQGLARIDDAGNLIWESSGRTYGPWGAADGYRVLDGALLPADPLKS